MKWPVARSLSDAILESRKYASFLVSRYFLARLISFLISGGFVASSRSKVVVATLCVLHAHVQAGHYHVAIAPTMSLTAMRQNINQRDNLE